MNPIKMKGQANVTLGNQTFSAHVEILPRQWSQDFTTAELVKTIFDIDLTPAQVSRLESYLANPGKKIAAENFYRRNVIMKALTAPLPTSTNTSTTNEKKPNSDSRSFASIAIDEYDLYAERLEKYPNVGKIYTV